MLHDKFFTPLQVIQLYLSSTLIVEEIKIIILFRELFYAKVKSL